MSSAVGHRRRPRPLEPRKQVPVDEALLRELLEARADLDAAKLRLRRITTRLQRRMGDAEFATLNGTPVIWREQARTGGHYVRVNHRDDLRVIHYPGPAAAPLRVDR